MNITDRQIWRVVQFLSCQQCTAELDALSDLSRCIIKPHRNSIIFIIIIINHHCQLQLLVQECVVVAGWLWSQCLKVPSDKLHLWQSRSADWSILIATSSIHMLIILSVTDTTWQHKAYSTGQLRIGWPAHKYAFWECPTCHFPFFYQSHWTWSCMHGVGCCMQQYQW